MPCTNQVVRFALSDASGVTGFTVSSKVEAGVLGLLVRTCTQVTGTCSDKSGNIYVADTEQHAIFKVTEGGTISLLAGLPGTSGDNAGSGTVTTGDARFNSPRGLACDNSGNVYVCDSGNNQIRVIHGAKVSLVAGNDAGTSGFTDGTWTTARFNNPVGICVDNSGVLFVTDSDNHAIRKIVGSLVTTIAGNGSSGNQSGVQALGANLAMFNTPVGIACDASGNLYVADSLNLVVKKITQNSWVYRFSGSGNSGESIGTGNYRMWNCKYLKPTAIACDRSQNVYLIDWGENNTRLIRLDNEGRPNAIADFGGTSYGNCPIAITVSPGQKIFLTFSDYMDEQASSSSSESSESIGNVSSSSSSESVGGMSSSSSESSSSSG